MEIQMSRVKGCLEWTFSARDVKHNKGKPIESDIFLIHRIPNCKFSILAQHLPSLSDTLVITVRKSNHERAEIDLIVVEPEPGPIQSYPQDDNWTTDRVFYFSCTFLRESSFTVICDITYYQPSSDSCNYVKRFLLNPSFSDFTIVIGKERLPVHKLILGGQSSVFLAMFESDMKESKEHKVTIEDVRLDVMKNVLSFLYTGSQEALNDSQMALDMWNVAEKYNIKALKDLCEVKLCGLITKSNIFEIFQHAVDHGLEKLRCACLNFFEDHKKEMADEPHFKTSFFEKTQLMYTLFYDLLQCKK